MVVVEDGPTLTHGGMPYGAGIVAARRFGAARARRPAAGRRRLDPRRARSLPGARTAASRRWATDPPRSRELEATLNAVDADLVLSATPIDLTRLLELNKPITRVRYELAQVGGTATGRGHRADRPHGPDARVGRSLMAMATP